MLPSLPNLHRPDFTFMNLVAKYHHHAAATATAVVGIAIL